MIKVDEKFRSYFEKNIKQVFLYITNRCSRGCKHCLYKTTLGSEELSKEDAVKLVRLFSDYGAKKITFLGGEPSEYDKENNNKLLFDILSECRKIGYKYIRFDTNGNVDEYFLKKLKTNNLVDNIAFSLDGPTKETNDKLRGKGSFDTCTRSIITAVKLGLYVSVTTCVNELTICRIEELIDFLRNLGVAELNFHPLFKMGIPRDNFSGGLHLFAEQWIKKYSQLFDKSIKNKYGIKLRLPQRFVSEELYKKDSERYNYCPVRLGERILIHPDGTLRICALCIGSKFHIGTFKNDQILFNMEDDTSEIGSKRIRKMPCMTQNIKHDGYVNLCISYKPCQKEFVWDEYGFNDIYC